MQLTTNITTTDATHLLTEQNAYGQTKDLGMWDIIICNTHNNNVKVDLFWKDSDPTVSDVYILKEFKVGNGETFMMQRRAEAFSTKDLYIQINTGSVSVTAYTSKYGSSDFGLYES